MLHQQGRLALSSHTLNLDMAILGQLAAATNTSSTGMLSTGRTNHAETERERWYTSYFHQGSLPKDVSLSPWHRGKSCCKLQSQRDKATHSWQWQKAPPKHHLIYFLAILRTLYFQLCEAACLLLPGRVPGYSRSDIQLLPSSNTK